MSDAEFQSIYASFLGQVKRYNSLQRRQLCEQTKSALVQILTLMPNPKPEEEKLSSISPEAMKALIELEQHIAEKMDQRNKLNESIFSQFDQNKSGKIFPNQFKTAIESIGIVLSNCELGLLTQKFGGEKKDGKICYTDFLQYVQAKRQISSGKFSRGTPHRSKSENKKNNPILKGLQKVRNGLNIQSSDVGKLFQRLENGNNLVSITSLITELFKLGFPKDAASDEEILTVARVFSRRTPGYFTYQEFLAFFEGRTPTIQMEEKLKSFNQPILKQVLLKINTQSLHTVFKSIDLDRDGVLTTDDLIQGLTLYGLPKAISNNSQFKEYVEFFMSRRKGCFGFPEFRRFVNCRGGNPHTKDTVHIPPSYSKHQILDILRKNPHINFLEMFNDLDPNSTNKVGFSQFRQCLNSTGYIFSDSQFEEIFSEFAINEEFDYRKFVRVISNGRTTTGIKILQAPGGTRSEKEVDTRGVRIIASPGGNSTIDFSNKSNEETPQKYSYRVLAPPGGVDHLNGDNLNGSPSQTHFKRKGKVIGPQDQIHQWDTIPDTTPLSRRKYHSGTPSSIDFGPYEPVRNSNRVHQPGGKSNLDISFKPHEDSLPRRSRKHVNTTSGRSVLDSSFVSTLENSTKTTRKSVESSVLTSSLDTSFTPLEDDPSLSSNRKINYDRMHSTVLSYDTKPPRRTQRARGEGRTESSVDLSFNSNSKDGTPKRNFKGNVQNPGGESQLSQSLTPIELPKSGQKKKCLDDLEAIVKRFEGSNDDDTKNNNSLLEKINKAVHSKGRVRQVFRKFNVSHGANGLSKDELRKGLMNLNVPLNESQVDDLYSTFDKDQDGYLTYPEFVRMLASSQKY